jgi:hypothetical protein
MEIFSKAQQQRSFHDLKISNDDLNSRFFFRLNSRFIDIQSALQWLFVGFLRCDEALT